MKIIGDLAVRRVETRSRSVIGSDPAGARIAAICAWPVVGMAASACVLNWAFGALGAGSLLSAAPATDSCSATATASSPGIRRGIRREWHAGHQDSRPVAAGELFRGTIRRNTAPRAPGPPASCRRAAPPEGPGRVRAALQSPPASPGAASKAPAARTRPGHRRHCPDRARTGRRRPRQRIPKSGLATAETPAQRRQTRFGGAQAGRRRQTGATTIPAPETAPAGERRQAHGSGGRRRDPANLCRRPGWIR